MLFGPFRFIFKFLLGLLFLAVFGLAVFTGTLLWKDEKLTWGNFFGEFFSNAIAIFEKSAQVLGEKQGEWSSDSKSPDAPEQNKVLKMEKRDEAMADLEALFARAKQQLAQADPTEQDYQAQLERTLRSFEGVQVKAKKILKSFSFKPDEHAKIEAILSESEKQIFWANKFLTGSE